jgi:hypothetical protein
MVPSWQEHLLVVRAGGLEPPRPVRVCGFSYHFGFRRLARRVRGLDYPFTIPRKRFRRCPSSLYTFPKTSGLGSGLPFKVSPTLSSSTPPVSRRALNLLKSAVSADFTNVMNNLASYRYMVCKFMCKFDVFTTVRRDVPETAVSISTRQLVHAVFICDAASLDLTSLTALTRDALM